MPVTLREPWRHGIHTTVKSKQPQKMKKKKKKKLGEELQKLREVGMMCCGQAAKQAVNCQHWRSLPSRLYATRHEYRDILTL